MEDRRTTKVRRDDSAAPGAVVYRFEGSLGEGADCGFLLHEMREQLRSGPPRVVVSLAGCEYLTSVGVGFLASCYATARNAGRTLVLADVPRQARRVLDLTGLGDVIPRYATVPDALASSGDRRSLAV
jgi:anti-anti-sigma factor